MKKASFYGHGRQKLGVNSFLLGMARHGYCVGDYDITDVDVAVFTGEPEETRQLRHQAEAYGIMSVVLDLGYMRRGSPSNPKGYLQAGLGKLCWVPPMLVPSDRFDALRLDVQNDRALPGGEWMIAGQVPQDTQHKLTENQLEDYYTGWLASILRSDVPVDRIYLRKHPHGPSPFRRWTGRVEFGNEVPLAESLARCAAVVTYNSTLFYEATMAGVPVLCHHGAHYSPLSSAAPDLLFYRSAADKLPFLHRMAYAQWTSEEMEKGKAIAFLEEAHYRSN